MAAKHEIEINMGDGVGLKLDLGSYEFQCKRMLIELLGDDKVSDYLVKKPTTRHEAWWLVTALASLSVLEEIRELRADLYELVNQSNNGNRPKKKVNRVRRKGD